MDSRNIIGKVYRKYEQVSGKSTHMLANVYGYKCEVYFPINNNPGTCNDHEDVNIFNIHKNAIFRSTPDVTENFYIPNLVKKQMMNSYNEFENFYLDEENERPFIECHGSYELVIGSKVVIYFTDVHTVTMIIDKITTTPCGAFLRQYLIPMV